MNETAMDMGEEVNFSKYLVCAPKIKGMSFFLRVLKKRSEELKK